MMLMVDISGSEFFGTNQQFKRDTATEIAATLAFSGTEVAIVGILQTY